jgi:hypothetical protein
MELFNSSLASLGHFDVVGQVQKRKKRITNVTYL